LTLTGLLNKYELLRDTAVGIPFDEKLAKNFVKGLPFTLTDAQRKVVWQIYQDLQKTQPANRLVEGDVGSGKTVVAAMAAVMTMAEGYQVALMAPTELLARQHAETIYALLNPLGLHDKVALLVGGMKSKEKEAAREAISTGRAQFIIGTHALIQESVDMHKLGLVIVDEQHRFGVEQRQKLLAKAGHMPHLLSLTATPIPRSLALTLYGELDVSILDAKPAGRQPIETKICSPNSRKQLNEEIENVLQSGRQMFVVCPLITESTTSAANSAEKIYEQFSKKDFKNWRVGLLHGKMKPAEKNEVMEKFVRHELDILVSTTVIEVGVDVPNASIMLIEAAERFGLAQIHQLRGRVGRGGHKGYCFLMMSDSSAPPKRLQALARMSDGFKLAELDLELRGPGAIYGTLQHGALDLRVAKLTDTPLIAAARIAAQEFIDKDEDLLKYPVVLERVTALRAVTNLN
jgi:ATP-dependent DNA helicase RecG